MVIDFHTHVFPEKIAQKTIDFLAAKSNGKPWTNGTVDELLEHMKSSKVDLSVALPVLTKPSQFESVNDFAYRINERFSSVKKDGLISFAGIHPKCEDIDGKMKQLKKLGFKGVKIHPDYQDAYIDDEGYIQVLRSAKEYDLIVVTHSGIDDGYIGEPVKCPPKLIKKVIDLVGHKKFVLGHYGSHEQWDEVLELIAGEDVYLDTAFCLHQIDETLFKKILEKHGDDKVLFATDCPWQNMESYLKILNGYNLGAETTDKILYKNALKLLDL
ncbi:MAG: metal-dependent hydrolase [Clostridiales bacterium]|nr:metal-dependent hydrolase [Clostridiales bacterium]